MIHPDWQGVGIGSCLQHRMVEYARSRGLRGFTADVLTENQKMLKLTRHFKNIRMTPSYGTYEVTMLFDDGV